VPALAALLACAQGQREQALEAGMGIRGHGCCSDKQMNGTGQRTNAPRELLGDAAPLALALTPHQPARDSASGSASRQPGEPGNNRSCQTPFSWLP
jgi:hypothetical protein